MNFNNSISYNFFKSDIIELSEVISINILDDVLEDFFLSTI